MSFGGTISDSATSIAMKPESPLVASAPQATPLSRQHIPALDGVRGWAVLMVMLLHFSTVLNPPAGSLAAGIRQVFQVGWSGVDLFFVLSGFLITGILIDSKGDEHFFRTFYGRRVLRIFPLYYGYLALYFTLGHVVPGPENIVPLRSQLWFWGYLGNFRTLGWDQGTMLGHLWSLAIEEQFYLVWPLVIFICTRERALKICVAAIIGAFVIRLTMLLFGVSGASVYHFTFGRVDGLAAGAFVALLIRDPSGIEKLRRWSRPAGLAAAAVLLAFIVRSHWMSAAQYTFQLMTVTFSAIVILFASILAAVITVPPTSNLARCFSSSLLVTLGKYSYALYVFHVPLIRVAGKLHLVPTSEMGDAKALLTLFAFPTAMILVSVAIAFASWHLYEKHFLNLKRFFEYSKPRSQRGYPRHFRQIELDNRAAQRRL